MSTAAAELAPPDRVEPPDVRGATGPLPIAVFVTGITALSIVIVGTIALQIVWALSGGRLTPECEAGGVTPDFIGARGVCNIFTAATSGAQTLVLVVAAALGLAAAAAGFGTYRRMDTRRKRSHAFSGAVVGLQATLLVAFIVWFRSGELLVFARNFFNFVLLKGQVGALLSGAKNTLFLAFTGELGGIVIGLTLAMFALAQHKVVRAPARAYINFFRGTPLLWQLSFFYFGLALGLRLPLSTFQTAILVFALNTGAYAAEVFRAGIQSIERSQMEAARGLGLSYLQAMRYAIVPQAVRRVIPPLMNEFVILIKDTSLILVLGLTESQLDLFNWAQSGYSSTFNATFFVFAAMGYLAVTLPLIRVVNWAERKLRSGLVGINVGQQGL